MVLSRYWWLRWYDPQELDLKNEVDLEILSARLIPFVFNGSDKSSNFNKFNLKLFLKLPGKTIRSFLALPDVTSRQKSVSSSNAMSKKHVIICVI
jgi:hypothetical protein